MADAASTGNQEFIAAAESIKNTSKSLTNEQLLKLYALFKQSIVGDNTTPEPSFYDLKGKAKWKEWTNLKGKDKAIAQKEYIALVNELK